MIKVKGKIREKKISSHIYCYKYHTIIYPSYADEALTTTSS